MYIELDGDDVAVTYIKDIVFNANRQDVEVLRMAKVLSQFFFFPLFNYLKSVSPRATMCDKFACSLTNLRKFNLNIEPLHPHYFRLGLTAASICDGQMDHWNPAEPASGLHSQL